MPRRTPDLLNLGDKEPKEPRTRPEIIASAIEFVFAGTAAFGTADLAEATHVAEAVAARFQSVVIVCDNEANRGGWYNVWRKDKYDAHAAFWSDVPQR